jgi:hydroxymethylpyrimidine pyrophosphatase-like HAD family hydrolase
MHARITAEPGLRSSKAGARCTRRAYITGHVSEGCEHPSLQCRADQVMLISAHSRSRGEPCSSLPLHLRHLQAIVTDLDGTLLRSDRTVSPYTAAVLKRLPEVGLKLIFATARPKDSALRIATPIAPTAPVIYSNGAAVYDPMIRSTLRRHTIPEATVRDIVSCIRSCFPGALIAVDSVADSKKESDRTLDPEWPANWGAALGDRSLWSMDARLPPPHSVICLMVLGAWPTHLEVPERWPVTVTSSGEGLIEFSAPSASKNSALQWLCKRLVISMDSVIAFGDMPTDAEMIANSGVGVAVANAHEDVKRVAQYIAGSNDEDGVARFLETLLSLRIGSRVFSR